MTCSISVDHIDETVVQSRGRRELEPLARVDIVLSEYEEHRCAVDDLAIEGQLAGPLLELEDLAHDGNIIPQAAETAHRLSRDRGVDTDAPTDDVHRVEDRWVSAQVVRIHSDCVHATRPAVDDCLHRPLHLCSHAEGLWATVEQIVPAKGVARAARKEAQGDSLNRTVRASQKTCQHLVQCAVATQRQHCVDAIKTGIPR